MKILSQISIEKIASFLFWININFIYSQPLNIYAKYPRCLLLQNGKLFTFNVEGIFLSNTDLTNSKRIYEYNNNLPLFYKLLN